MPSCVIKHCKSCSQNQKKEDGISFHKLPKDPVLNEKWVSVIRQSRQDVNWKASKFCVVCSLHFKEDDFYFSEKGRRLIKKSSKPTVNLISSEVSSIVECIINPDPLEDQPCSSKSLQGNQVSGETVQDDSLELEGLDSDMESMFDTPRESRLRKDLKKYKLLYATTKRKLKTLQQKNRRLIKRNTSLTNILKKLDDKMIFNYMHYDTHNS